MRMGRWMSEALHMCCPIVKTRPRCLCVREKERKREIARARARERVRERERERENYRWHGGLHACVRVCMRGGLLRTA